MLRGPLVRQSPQAVVPGTVQVCVPEAEEVAWYGLHFRAVKVTCEGVTANWGSCPQRDQPVTCLEKSTANPIAAKPDFEKLLDLLIKCGNPPYLS